MDFITNKSIFTLFYFGTFLIILGFIFLIYFHFKKDNYLKIEEHWGIIITYVLLMIIAIYLWGIFLKFLYMTLIKIELSNLMETKIG